VPTTITTLTLPGGEIGATYSQTIAATGSGSITYAVTNGTLPAGLKIDALTGVIAGTPTATSGPLTFLADMKGTTALGGIVADADGNLYGTTEEGGPSNLGTAFEFPAGGSAVATIASFNGRNGSLPLIGVIIDAQGNLLGASSGGGAFGNGVVLKIAAGTSTITDFVAFNGANGSSPSYLVEDPSGSSTAPRRAAAPSTRGRSSRSPRAAASSPCWRLL
jgi:uncharacterized repeat protein (TIGR03803 family)